MTSHSHPLYFEDNVKYSYVNRVSVEETDHVDFIYQVAKPNCCTQNNSNFSTFDNSKIIEPLYTKFTNYEDFKERTYGLLHGNTSAPTRPMNLIPLNMGEQKYINIEFYEACYPIRVTILIKIYKNVKRIWAQKSDDQWFLLWNEKNWSFQMTSIPDLYNMIPNLWPCDFKTKVLKLEYWHHSGSCMDIAVMLIGTSELILPRCPKENLSNLLGSMWQHIRTYREDPHSNVLQLQKNFDKYCIICKSDTIESFHESKLGYEQVSQQMAPEVPSFRQGYLHRFLKNCLNYKMCVKDVKPPSDESKEIISACNFSTLSDEVILEILKNLDVTSLSRMSRVNKRFNNLSRDPLLYKCLNLRNIHLTYMHTSICQFFDYFAPRCKRILQLDLAYCEFFAPEFREFIKTCCRHLTHLRLSHCDYVFNSNLRDISEICKNLKELDLNYCGCISNEGILHLKNLQFLESLQLARIPRLQTKTLCDVLQKNRQMRNLNLANTRLNIDTVAIELKNCFNLERLNLMDCSFTSQGIDALADCKNLKEINFSSCKIIDSSDNGGVLYRLFSSCQRLEKVDLSKFEFITKRDLETLALCKNLKYLNLVSLDSVTPDICSQFFTKCSKLIEIDLTFCENISQSLVDQWNEILNTKKMTSHSHCLVHFKNNINYSYVNRVSVKEADHVDFIYQVAKPNCCTRKNSSRFVNSKLIEQIKPIKFTEYEDFKERTYELLHTPPMRLSDFITKYMAKFPLNYINIEFYEACYPVRVTIPKKCGYYNVERIWAQKSDDQWFILWDKKNLNSVWRITISGLYCADLRPYDFKTKMLKLEWEYSISYRALGGHVMLIGTSEFILPRSPKWNLNNVLERIRRINRSYRHNYKKVFNTTPDLKDPHLDVLQLQENFDEYCIICKSDIIESFHKSKLGHEQVSQQMAPEVPSFRQGYLHRFLKNCLNHKKCVKDVKPVSDESTEIISACNFSTLSSQ
ncbi:PREDICTED: uncharacterized protein LOC105450742 [Wasmannia auropunctata]|uniref:uncharacterized protein LOC105450742 n=1 Tax=Wasmannia auropunctata TaxID=64793 RepID=UPI0005F0A6FC|nr:PREDICTED: uncharacterized protein LOC105450742 [Wasmannia auropunctata]